MNGNGERPQDRIHRKKEKPPTRLVKMQLEVELCQAIEEMARHTKIGGFIPGPRKFHEMLVCSLEYAVWKFTQGAGPDKEMLPRASSDRGYLKWKEDFHSYRLRSMPSKETISELERLYKLGEDAKS